MPRIRRLTSRELLALLKGFGFEVESMRGSHAKLVRTCRSSDGRAIRDVLVVPVHRTMPVGTIQAIYRQAKRFVPEDELKAAFFH